MRHGLASSVCVVLLLGAVASDASIFRNKSTKNCPIQLRAEYLTRVQEKEDASSNARSVGSLWLPGSVLGDLSTDFKAKKLNDPLVVLVSVQTSAAQSGNSSYQRAFQTSSGITGLPGNLKTTGVNSLFDANSSTSLKGQGATSSNTAFTTALTGQIIAVLPSGNLVVEAQRRIFMNNQHEDITVRGIVRPADIASNNTVSSASLISLEVEMKGKGIISDATRNLNPITKAILWLFGF